MTKWSPEKINEFKQIFKGSPRFDIKYSNDIDIVSMAVYNRLSLELASEELRGNEYIVS